MPVRDYRVDQRLRACERMRLQSEYAKVYSLRFFAADDVLTVYVAPNELSWSRVGLSVSRKAGNAVRRNLIRRRLREAFRKTKAALPPGMDILCVVKQGPPVSEKSYADRIELLALKAARRLKRR